MRAICTPMAWRDPRSEHDAPALSLLFGEARVLAEWGQNGRGAAPLDVPPVGQRQPVLVLPGFFARDLATRRLRRTLRNADYWAFGWGEGRNLGVKPDTVARIDRRMERISNEAPGPVTLIGWSLGGLMAREYAKQRPERVARVITLGSPFSGNPRANNVWRLYEMVARHPVDAPPVASALSEKPPVPTIAIWSPNDGVIAPACARGQPGERDAAIEVGCTHLCFPSDEQAIRAVLAAMAETPPVADV